MSARVVMSRRGPRPLGERACLGEQQQAGPGQQHVPFHITPKSPRAPAAADAQPADAARRDRRPSPPLRGLLPVHPAAARRLQGGRGPKTDSAFPVQPGQKGNSCQGRRTGNQDFLDRAVIAGVEDFRPFKGQERARLGNMVPQIDARAVRGPTAETKLLEYIEPQEPPPSRHTSA